MISPKINFHDDERMTAMFNEKILMIKMTDILHKEKLISYDEYQKMKSLIRESEEV